MSKKFELKPIAAAVGAALTASVIAMPIANADANPFDLTELSSGYMVAEMEEGKCGEGKCGGDKGKEGSCGEKAMKALAAKRAKKALAAKRAKKALAVRKARKVPVAVMPEN